MYLSYFGAKSNFDNALQTEFPKGVGKPNFEKMGTGYLQQLYLTAYDIWEEDTQDITAYNGLGTDWCSACLEATDFSSGDISAGGEFSFVDGKCPGVGSTLVLNSLSGDLDYAQENCEGLFNAIDYYIPYLAGIATPINGTVDDYYAPPPLESLTLDSAESGVSITAALVLAAISGTYAALAVSDTIKRVRNSFSNVREESLPGKRNKYFNALTLSVSGIQSLIRATPVGVGAWYYLQDRVDNTGLLWLVVSATTLSGGMNYFNDFDDVYSRIPNSLRKVFSSTREKFMYAIHSSQEIKKDAHIICDERIEQINKMIDMISNARKEVITELKEVIA